MSDDQREVLLLWRGTWMSALEDAKVGLCVALRQGNGTEACKVLEAMAEIGARLDVIDAALAKEAK